MLNSELPIFNVILDIDGVLMNNEARLREFYFMSDGTKRKMSDSDWINYKAAYALDTTLIDLNRLVSFIGNFSKGVAVRAIFSTGRSESELQATKMQLKWHHKLLESRFVELESTLFMRKDGDRRPSEVIKEENYNKILFKWGRVHLAIDDNAKCIEMYKRHRVPCIQPHLQNISE